eukprot:366467-Chlamydomonas_euryale.AAC.12
MVWTRRTRSGVVRGTEEGALRGASSWRKAAASSSVGPGGAEQLCGTCGAELTGDGDRQRSDRELGSGCARQNRQLYRRKEEGKKKAIIQEERRRGTGRHRSCEGRRRGTGRHRSCEGRRSGAVRRNKTARQGSAKEQDSTPGQCEGARQHARAVRRNKTARQGSAKEQDSAMGLCEETRQRAGRRCLLVWVIRPGWSGSFDPAQPG